MRKHEILNHEFDVDHAARVMLEVELVRTVGVRIMHALSHGQHFLLQRIAIALLPQHRNSQLLEALADLLVTGAEARARQRLMLPDPG